MPAPITRSFLIRRFNIVLNVVLYESNLVQVEPFRCTKENFRLWSGIAKTQALLAQTQLAFEPTASPLQALITRFKQDGWDAVVFEEALPSFSPVSSQ
jgi:hypothetical protein